MRNWIMPPWSDEQVAALNAYQRSGRYHPFTCPHRDNGAHIQRDGADLGELVAMKNGWWCGDCGYTQKWPHRFMAEVH